MVQDTMTSAMPAAGETLGEAFVEAPKMRLRDVEVFYGCRTPRVTAPPTTATC